MKIAMIMLAAGNSRRFGSNKLLYKIEGTPMYRRVLMELETAKKRLESDVQRNAEAKPEITLTVVTQYEEIAEYAKGIGAEVFYNHHPEEGISSSLKIGLKANEEADACLFCVSDQPWLTGATLCRLIKEFLTADKGIACLSYDGKLGNPCIFSKKYYGELLALEGDKGGKRVIHAHREDTEILSVIDKKELEDMDFLAEERYTKRK